MANIPTLSIRVPPDRQDLVRRTMARLNADPGFADALRTLLADPDAPDVLARLPRITKRLGALERWVHDHSAAMPAKGRGPRVSKGAAPKRGRPPGKCPGR
jgi:hypothetical protein